jgi:hypothetical protein
VFAFHIVAIIGHWKLSLYCLLNRRNERTSVAAVPQGRPAMKISPIALITVLLAAVACSRHRDPEPPVKISAAAAPVPAPAALGTKTRAVVHKSAIDPKSVEAAGQVIRQYGALIEQRQWKAAAELWGDPRLAEALARQLRREAEVHLEIGDLGKPEGAAGSIYVTMPIAFYGMNPTGKSFRRAAEIVLRRVNDVPGSTEAQRRWHIERIDWKNER